MKQMKQHIVTFDVDVLQSWHLQTSWHQVMSSTHTHDDRH